MRRAALRRSGCPDPIEAGLCRNSTTDEAIWADFRVLYGNEAPRHEVHDMNSLKQPKLLAALFSLLFLLMAAAALALPASAQGGGGISGTWIFEGPVQPNGSHFRTYNVFRRDGTYQTTTITLNGPPSVGRVDGTYTLQPQGPGQYALHIVNSDYAPKQICIRGGFCRPLNPPPPTLDDHVTVSGGTMRFASGMVVQRGTMPQQLAVAVPAVRIVAPAVGRSMQGPAVSRGSGSGGGPQPSACRNNVEQQRCISLGGSSYMYTDNRGCRVCQYVP